MKLRVKGQYRHDSIGHTEQGIKTYDEIVVIADHLHKGHALPEIAKILKKKDPSFDSIRTHHFKLIVEPPVEEPAHAEPIPEPIATEPVVEPAGEDSGEKLFE